MNEQLRFILGIAAMVGVVAAVWLLAVAPKREEAVQLGAEVALAQQRLTDANERVALAERARGTYARDYATVARLGKAVPINADVPSLVFQLESAARGSNVDFRAVTASDPLPEAPGTPAAAASAGGGVQPAPFTFKFTGSYFGLEKLLAGIDRFSRVKGTGVAVSGRLLTIDALTLNPKAQGKTEIQGLVTARAYVAQLPDPLPAAGAPATPVSAGATPTPTVTP